MSVTSLRLAFASVGSRLLASLREWVRDGGSLLDLGSGDGWLVEVLAREFNIRRAVCVDVDEEKLGVAAQRGCEVVRHDLNYPLELGERFDLIVSSGLVEYLVKADALMRTVVGASKPGTVFMLQAPNLAWWVNRLLLLFGFQPYYVEVMERYYGLKIGGFGAIHSFTLREAKAMLRAHGFRILKVITYCSKTGFQLLDLLNFVLCRGGLAMRYIIVARYEGSSH
jgi:SAM-dependent methyltransferase